MELSQIKKLLQDRVVAKVAEATKLNPHTIYRIKHGKAKPNKSTIKLLSEYLGNIHGN